MAHTILLIDYDPKSIGRIRRILAGCAARVVLARSGPSGLEEYHRLRPDLTIVQDLIPSRHGFDVCREIKSSDGGASHPVVLVCARHSHSVLVETGCDAYILKPFGDEELLDVLMQLLPGVTALTQPGVAVRQPVPDLSEQMPDSSSIGTDGCDCVEAEIVERVDIVFGSVRAPTRTAVSTAGAKTARATAPRRRHREAVWARK